MMETITITLKIDSKGMADSLIIEFNDTEMTDTRQVLQCMKNVLEIYLEQENGMDDIKNILKNP